LTKPAITYAAVTFDFLLDELLLTITDKYTNETFFARSNYNLQEINQLLTPGEYTIEIRQAQAFKFYSGDGAESLKHCAYFSLDLIVSNTWNDVCGFTVQLPYNLSVPEVSDPFGGHLDHTGVLHLSGSTFLAPPRGQNASVVFATTMPSILTVMASLQLKDVPPPNIHLFHRFSFNLETLIQPVATGTFSGFDSISMYLLNGTTSSPEQHDLILNFGFPPLDIMKCKQFAFDFNILPIHELEVLFTCPENSEENEEFPPSSIDYHSGIPGLAIQRVSKLYPRDSLSIPHFIYFDVANTTRMRASIRFNSFQNLFSLFLQEWMEDGWVTTNIGLPNPINGASGYMNLETSMSSSPSAGSYRLAIVPTDLSGVLPTKPSRMCHPYTWTLELTPNNVAFPYIREIYPLELTDLLPTHKIELTVRFSTEPLYEGKELTQLSLDTMAGIFRLINDEGDSIQLVAAFAVDRDPNRLTYDLEFAPTLKPGKPYRFLIVPNKLYNQYNREFVNPYETRYEVVSGNCSNHGQFENGLCSCERGYIGLNCERCDDGYYPTHDSTGKLTCKETSCRIDTCGCRPGTSGENCDPLGTCHDSPVTGKPYCRCNTGYAGESCNRCDDGYINYPHCTVIKHCASCPSHRGACNLTTGICECIPRFVGESCETCAQYYSGENCDSYNPPWLGGIDAVKGIGIVIGIIFLLGGIVTLIYLRNRKPTSPRGRQYYPSDVEGEVEEEEKEDKNFVDNIDVGIGSISPSGPVPNEDSTEDLFDEISSRHTEDL
jgi:hypothetical protein